MKMQNTLSILLLLASYTEDRTYVVAPHLPYTKEPPFSNAVVAGDTLYLAGHIGLDPGTGQPPAKPDDEARLVMDLTKQTLESAGMSMDDVVSLQVFCTDLNLNDTFNAVYVTYFHDRFPARAFIGIDKLVGCARFEVTGIAVRRSNPKVPSLRP